MASTLDPKTLMPRTTSVYPPEFAKMTEGRAKRALGDPFGLTQFGVNVTELPPGAWSSHRHWHEKEDEFVYVLGGEVVLVDDHGEHVLTAGMCAGFKANSGNGHHLINRSDKPAHLLEVGSRHPDEHVRYNEADMEAVRRDGKWSITRKDGSEF